MNDRPRLLFLSQILPYPPHGGVSIRTYNILRLLSQTFDITALCFYRSKEGMIASDLSRNIDALKSISDVEAFPIPQEQSKRRFVWDHLRSVGSARAYTRFAYESAGFRAQVRTALRSDSYDLVHADSLDLSGYFPLVDELPLVCVHHDVQSLLLARRARVESTRLRRAYLRHQSKLMAREEREWCGRVDLNVTVSPLDRAALERRIPDGKYTVVPNGVDTDYFQPVPGSDEAIVFVGGMTWFPNKDAFHYFRREILPLMRRSGIHAPVRWVGRCSASERQSLPASAGVELTGYVPDIRPYVRDAGCYIVPLRVGGGTRLKILDAWAMGKAVVSTSIGCEGLAAVDGDNILVRDTPEEFARAVGNILRDRELRARLGEAGRRTIEATYSWTSIGEGMKQTYLQLVAPRSSSGRRGGILAVPG